MRLADYGALVIAHDIGSVASCSVSADTSDQSRIDELFFERLRSKIPSKRERLSNRRTLRHALAFELLKPEPTGSPSEQEGRADRIALGRRAVRQMAL
jgi:hypothetical protein